jgi:hypothetical protein
LRHIKNLPENSCVLPKIRLRNCPKIWARTTPEKLGDFPLETPAVTLPNFAGKTRLEEFQMRPVVVPVWASHAIPSISQQFRKILN